MRKNLIVFTGGPKAYAPRRMLLEGKNLGVDVDVIAYNRLSLAVTSQGLNILKGPRKLNLASGVFFRGMGEDSAYTPLKYYLMHWYEGHKGKVLNSESFKKWPSMDKITQYLILREAKLPIVKSRVFGSKKALATWAKRNGFPFIVKFNIGSCGWDVFKITSRTALNKLLKSDYNIKTLIVQEFLKTAEDIRVIVLDGRVLGAMKRTAPPGKFLTNYSQGASVSSYDIFKDKAALKLALSAARATKVDYAGIDLMKNNEGKWVVLEINRACQFEGFEKATGVNVAKQIIRYLG